jgi:hypothetical protein
MPVEYSHCVREDTNWKMKGWVFLKLNIPAVPLTTVYRQCRYMGVNTLTGKYYVDSVRVLSEGHQHHELVRLRSLKTCSVIAPRGVLGLSIFVVVGPSLSFRQVDI